MIVELAPPPAFEPPKAPEAAQRDDPRKHREDGAGSASRRTRPSRTDPAAARAGALLTAKDDTSKPSDAPPVDFVTDPSGTTYGGGVVARGGTADFGVRGATAAGRQRARYPSTAPSDGVTPAANLSRPPRSPSPTRAAGFTLPKPTSTKGARLSP